MAEENSITDHSQLIAIDKCSIMFADNDSFSIDKISA